MLLALDIGNTNIVIGIFDDGKVTKHWRIGTSKKRTVDEYVVILRGLMDGAGIDVKDIKGTAVSCVVPPIKEILIEALTSYIGKTPLVVGPGTKTSMPILTDDPREVGADRIVNAVAAYSLYKDKSKEGLIVVDFGTAITFDYITPEGEYSGGAIAPGISVSSEALFEKAARLPRIELDRPKSVVGKNTIDSIKSGILFGFVGLVDGIVENIKKECGGEPYVIATGGLSHLIIKESSTIDTVDDQLILKGLKIIYEVNA